MLAGADKLGLGEESMAFLGYQLKSGELHCDLAKTDAISHPILLKRAPIFAPFLD